MALAIRVSCLLLLLLWLPLSASLSASEESQRPKAANINKNFYRAQNEPTQCRYFLNNPCGPASEITPSNDSAKAAANYQFLGSPLVEWLTFGAVVGTLILLVIHACIFQRQATANIIAANAAKKSAETAALTLLQNTRPFLYVIRVIPGFKDPYDHDAGVSTTLQVENFGPTPATIIEYAWGIRAYEKLPPNPDYSDFSTIKVRKFIRSQKLKNLPLINHFRITEDLRRANSSGAQCCLFGYVRYQDIVGRMRKRKFAVDFDPSIVVPGTWIGGNPYNGEDDEGKNDPP